MPWPTISDLAQAAGISGSRLHQLFLECYSQTPGRYLMQLRLQQAQRLLREKSLTVTEIAHNLGFSSSQHFAATYRRYLGYCPSELRNGRPSHAKQSIECRPSNLS